MPCFVCGDLALLQSTIRGVRGVLNGDMKCKNLDVTEDSTPNLDKDTFLYFRSIQQLLLWG